MNVGQILETHLGWSCSELGDNIKKLIDENQNKKNYYKVFKKNIKCLFYLLHMT